MDTRACLQLIAGVVSLIPLTLAAQATDAVVANVRAIHASTSRRRPL